VRPGFQRTAAILAAFLLGALLPQAHAAIGAVRWLVIGMLFVVFLQTRLSRDALHRSHAVLLAANLAMGFVAWGFGWIVGGRDVALAAFFAGITPTATAAPVIMSFLRGRVAYVVAAFILTNIVIAALLPVLLPLVLGRATPEACTQVLGSVGLVVFAPMALAWLVRTLHPAATRWPARLANVSFAAWVTAIFLITANASQFLRNQAGLPRTVVFEIAATTLLVCAANFSLGRLIGGREFPREGSQSLGQKNTTFTIYLAITYANPLVALGPTFYVLWHNLWNSWQLHRAASAPPSDATSP
jgi:BASS family bile acid:Na+ symporter